VKTLIILMSTVAICAAQAAPSNHVLKETTTRLTYIRNAGMQSMWAVQDFTTTVQSGTALVAVERDPRMRNMCYAVTEHDKMDAIFFAVRVPCAAIR
jgi:hypothetical protein